MSSQLQDALGMFAFLAIELSVLFIGISLLVGVLQRHIPPSKVEALRSCPTGWCKSRRSKVGSGSGQAATAGRLTMGLWLTEPRVSSVM
jgi:hypothetical protein